VEAEGAEERVEEVVKGVVEVAERVEKGGWGKTRGAMKKQIKKKGKKGGYKKNRKRDKKVRDAISQIHPKVRFR
jgi:hypothetical protein